jgi:predicted RNase H-like nuclease (RuvC/YqgF family)
MFHLLLLPALTAFSLALASHAQDSQSLGDVARQTRQQKQAKSADPKAAQPSKVITNDQIPEHASTPAEMNAEPERGSSSPHYSTAGGKIPAERWKAQIQAQKNIVKSLQQDVDRLNSSIHFVQANLYRNGLQYNQRQTEKQQELERLQSQLEEQKHRLDDMQESARKQGYGSSVYDP